MKKYFLISLYLLSPVLIWAQYNWDFGGGIGGANYLGEIGGYDKTRRGFIADMRMSQTRQAANVFVRRRVIEGLYVNVGVYYGRIQCADSLSIYGPRRGRNLAFRNDIIELSARAEYPFFTTYDVGSTGRYILDFRTFVFLGVGGFYNNPKAQDRSGKWVALQPLNTEGPDHKYGLYQLCFPFGVGFYYTYRKTHRIGWELGWRYSLTDYIDDASTVTPERSQVSEEAWEYTFRSDKMGERGLDVPDTVYYSTAGSIRGNPKKKDNYVFTNVTYSYVIKGRYKNRRFRPTKLGIGGLGDVKRRKKRKTRAKF